VVNVIGAMQNRITIQAPAAGQDAFGEPIVGWTDICTVWAAIDDLSGRQYIAAQAGQNVVETTITIRYRAGITAAMRVLHGADVYDIEAVLGQDRRTLQLMCNRGVSNG